MSTLFIQPTGANVRLPSKEAQAKFKEIDAKASKEAIVNSKKHARRYRFSNAVNARALASETLSSALKSFNESVDAKFHGNTLADPEVSLKYALIALSDVKVATDKVEVLREENQEAKAKAKKAKAKAKKAIKKAKSKLLQATSKGNKKDVLNAKRVLENLEKAAYEKNKKEALEKAAAEAKAKKEKEAKEKALIKSFKQFKAKKDALQSLSQHLINVTPFKTKAKVKEAVKAKVKLKARKAAKARKAHRAIQIEPSKVAQACMSYLFKVNNDWHRGTVIETKAKKEVAKAAKKAIAKAARKAAVAARRAIVKVAKDAKALIEGAKILAKLKLARELYEQANMSSFDSFNEKPEKQFARQCIESMGLQTAFMSDGNDDVVDKTNTNSQTSSTTETVVETENQSMKTDDKVLLIGSTNDRKQSVFKEHLKLNEAFKLRFVNLKTKEALSASPLEVVRSKAENAGEGVLVQDTSLEIENANIGTFIKYLMGLFTSKDCVYKGRKATVKVHLAKKVDSKVHVWLAEVKGTISNLPKGQKGFGFDKWFIPEGTNKTLSESKSADKDAGLLAISSFLNNEPTEYELLNWKGLWQEETIAKLRNLNARTELADLVFAKEKIPLIGERVFLPKEFLKNGNRFFNEFMESISDSIDSSLLARPSITIKLFPSQDKDLIGHDKRNYHDSIPKITVGASFQWASAFEAQYRQMVDWTAEYVFKTLDSVNSFTEARALVTEKIFPLKKNDIVYVQNLKDASGRKCSDKTVTQCLTKAGYYPVTPGMWLSKTCKWAQNWIASNMGSVKDQRERSRALATTPIQDRLDVDKDGKVIPVFVYDFNKFYQLAADGSNQMSYNLKTLFSDSIVQSRHHNLLNAVDVNERQFSGFHGKGLLYRVKAWAVPTETSAGDRIWKLSYEEVEGAVPCVMLDVGNIKGDNAQGIKDAVAELAQGEMLQLNNWGGSKDVKLYKNSENNDVVVLGGIIAKDSDGTSTISWQDTALYSLDTMSQMMDYLTEHLTKKAKAFYNYSGNALGSIIADPAFLSAAASLKALNPNTVNKLVFGGNQKIKTKYCEQIAMPSTLTVASDKYIKKNKKKMFTHNVDGVDMYGCAIRRTPQLFHQCVLYTHLLTYSMVGDVLKDFKAYLTNSKKALTGVSLYVANQFEEWMKDNSLFNGDDYWSSFNGKHIEYAIKAFERMQISFEHSPELIWMSKDNQDLIQADSDGDRILFTVKKELVKWACLHVQSIKDLPLIKPEVCPSTPLDGGDKVKLLKTLRPFQYGEKGGEHINEYICAKDGGMGPVGFMINLCSTVLSKITWSTVDGQWNAHQTKNAFKFFGFMVLLVQNSLDRVKKPWLVAALNGWWKVDTSKIIVGGKDYEECSFNEIWPTMGLGKEIRQVASRSSEEEMYNLSGLKLFVTWMINLVKLNYEFDCPDEMMKDINNVALLFANSSDEKPLDWQKVKDAFGNKIDDVSIEELEAGWVWPDRLHAWKKEASLEIPLSDAPPALNLLSEKVVEIFNKVKEEKGIYEAPYELVKEYLLSNVDTAIELKQGIWFCKDLFNALQEIRGLDHDEKATSEYFNAQASYDANKHLKDMKRAFDELSQTDGVVNKIAFMALKGSDVRERKEAVKAFMIVLLRSWHTGYSEWLRLRKPFEWLKETHVDFVANKAAQEKGDSLLSSLLKALKLDKVEKNDKKEDKFTDACLRKQATLVEWLQTNPLDPKDIITLQGFGKAAQNAFLNWLDHSSLADTTKHWTEVLWEEWIPALEIQADLSEEQDDKTSFYHDTNLVDSLVELIKSGNDETIKQDLVKQAKLFVISTTNKNEDALSENNAERLASCIEGGNFGSGEILNAKIGYLFKEGFEKFNKKYLIKMIQPVIAGYRLDNWLDTWDILKTDLEKKEEILTSCLMNQRSYMKTVDGEPQLKVYKTLKSKVIYPVDPIVTANIAGAFMEERSFYLLMKQTSIYLSKGTPRVSNAMRWVLWSRPQARTCGDDKTTIYNQLLTGIGIGHCFNVSMLRLIQGITQGSIENGDNVEINKLKVGVIENVLANQAKFVTMTQSETSKELTNDETIKRNLIDNEICLPYHWGGSRKANNSYGRSSPYRSTFRFIFSIFGGPENNTDQHKELTFQLFTELTSSTFFKKTKKLDVETMSADEIQAELIKKLSAVVSTTHNIVENKGKNKEPRCPWTMPGSYMVVGETAQEWLKPPKSPDREVVGSVEFTNLRILKTYSQKGVFLSYYDKSLSDNAGKPTLMRVEPFREKAMGSATWNATQTSRSITSEKGIKKLNGMDAAWVIASRISGWKNGDFSLVKGDDLREALQSSYNANPTFFKRALAEYLLGMLHTTSLIDTFSVSKFSEGEYMLSLRMLTKVPYFLKSFVRSCHGATPNIVLGDDVISMLLNQFRGDK